MRKFNISIIVMDTLRLDTFKRLSRKRGMELSRLGNFTVLDKCIAPATWTLPSHASLFTGQYPSEHGAHETRTIKCLDIERIMLRSKTFITDLKNMGYKTYAITSNPYLNPVYGFDEFDRFLEETYFTDVYGSVVEVSAKIKPLISKYRNRYGTNVLKISTAVLSEDPGLFFEALATGLVLTPLAVLKKMKAKMIDGWPLEKGGKNMVRTIRRMRLKKPFLFFANFMEAHDPYVGEHSRDLSWATSFMKEKVDPRMVESWKGLYLKASVKGYQYAYETVKDLIDRFGDDQMIILTSDHGQSLNESGYVGHGVMLTDETVRVPLAVMMPKGFEAVRSDDYSSLVNVRGFIAAALQGDSRAMERLYSKVVRSESFGIPENITHVKGIDLGKLRRSEKVRVREFRSPRDRD